MNKMRRLCVAMAAMTILIASGLAAQDSPRLTFDVASIKPNTSSNGIVGLGMQPGGRLTASGVTLRLLMRQAYRVQDYQIIGGPAWASSDRYDVEAKAPEGPVTQNQMAPMIQS